LEPFDVILIKSCLLPKLLIFRCEAVVLGLGDATGAGGQEDRRT
jgi:hypothetical protein